MLAPCAAVKACERFFEGGTVTRAAVQDNPKSGRRLSPEKLEPTSFARKLNL